MLRISVVLFFLSFCFLIVFLFVWGMPAISNISIRAPTGDSGIVLYIQRKYERRRKALILSEMGNAELFIERMLLSSVNTVHEIIGVAADMTVRLKPYFQRCYNRYFSMNTDAIEMMKQELDDDSFSVLCDALIHAAEFSRQEMGVQVGEHLEHLKKLREYKRQQVISHKETKFAITMILPVIAFMIVQLYPWLVQAVEQLSIVW